MFKKLKDKFKKWLLREELLKLSYIDSQIDYITIMADHAKKVFIESKNKNIDTTEKMKQCIKTCEQLRDICTPLLDVGMDVGFREDHSWAVVCIKGKPEYVKFIPMEHKDTEYLIHFLKQYEKSNRVIDSPLAFRGMFDRKMFI